MVSKDSKFESVQALRFVAATMVVLFHVTGPKNVLDVTFDHGLIKFLGYAGVDIFFVISGFVIWRSGRDLKRQEALFFGYRRAVRIYTAYLPAAALMLLLLWASSSMMALDRIVWVPSLTLYPIKLNEAILKVSWTLSFELYFYLLFMIAIRFDARYAVLGFLGLCAAAGSVAAIAGTWPDNRLFRLATSPLLFEFLFGCAIGYALEKRQPSHGVIWLAFGILAFLGVGIAYLIFDFQPNPAIRPLLRVCTYGLASVSIVWGLIGCEARFSVPRPLSFLGEASYAIYLLHFQVYFFFWHVLPIDLGFTFLKENALLTFLAIIIACYGLSSLYYLRVEQPLYRAFLGLWHKRPLLKGA